MAIVQRGKKWNLNDNGDGTYTYSAHTCSVNYQDELEQWLPIDCQIVESLEVGWDYEVVKNYWYLKVNVDGTV